MLVKLCEVGNFVAVHSKEGVKYERIKKIDKEHPDYPLMLEKFHDLQRRMEEETATIPPFSGKDGPLGEVHRKYSKELDKLMKEFDYLYTK